jgi:hypothetical protein
MCLEVASLSGLGCGAGGKCGVGAAAAGRFNVQGAGTAGQIAFSLILPDYIAMRPGLASAV